MKSTKRKPFSKDILQLKILNQFVMKLLKNLKMMLQKLQRRGAVVGISGGIDSSVVLALSAKAFGPKNVLGIMLPEQDSSDDSEC